MQRSDTPGFGLLDDLDDEFFQRPWKARLDDYVDSFGHPPTVLHIGNIANNGYNNAKILNAAGVWCDVIAYDYYHIMGCPEWEDADIVGVISNDMAPDWGAVDLGDFVRPSWFVQGPRDLCNKYLVACGEDNLELATQRWAALERARQAHTRAAESPGAITKTWHRRRRIAPALRRRTKKMLRKPAQTVRPSVSAFDERVSFLVAEFERIFPDRPDKLTAADLEPYRSVFDEWRTTFQYYDIIEGNSTDPILPMLVGSKPYVAYEHGTIREIPFVENAVGRLTALAYALADAVVITNPDCHDAALRLKVRRIEFVPHLIDRKYYDDQAAAERALPPGVRAPYVFCPARQHWSDKGNDIAIRAFAEVCKSDLNLQLVLSKWGPDVDRSQALLFELDIAHRAQFIDPLRIRDLIAVTRGASVLIDQFHFAVFGGIGPTALACGTPLVTNFDHSFSEWCMEEPPLFHATDVASCTTSLAQALSINRQEHAKEQRAWMQTNYWYGDVASRHIDVYLDILAPGRQSTRSTPTA